MGLRCLGGPWVAESIWSSRTAGDRTPRTHRNGSWAESLPGSEGLGCGSWRTLSRWEDRGQASDSCSPASQPARQSPWTPGLVRPRFLGEPCLGPHWARTCREVWGPWLDTDLGGRPPEGSGRAVLPQWEACEQQGRGGHRGPTGIGEPGLEPQVLGGKAQRDRQAPWMFSPGPDPRAAL